uniref:BTB domain-containing protein n=1 Tax=Mola mola TaxID=94237 RepID=A0A3Q3X7P3_MOLML
LESTLGMRGGSGSMEFGTVLGSANAPPNSETVPESASKIRHLTMSQQSQNLLRFLNEDRTRQKFCDVSVSVGGKLYNAHKVVLAHGSSYFHAELSKNPYDLLICFLQMEQYSHCITLSIESIHTYISNVLVV